MPQPPNSYRLPHVVSQPRSAAQGRLPRLVRWPFRLMIGGYGSFVGAAGTNILFPHSAADTLVIALLLLAPCLLALATLLSLPALLSGKERAINIVTLCLSAVPLLLFLYLSW